MPFPTIVSVTESGSDFARTHTVNYPASGINSGDLLLFIGCTDGAGDVFTLPAGDWADNELFNVNSSAHGKSVSWKLADGTENGGSFEVTTPSNEGVTLLLYHITGWDSATPPESTASFNQNEGSGRNWIATDPITVSWGSADTLWLAVHTMDGAIVDDVLSGAPSGYSDEVYYRFEGGGASDIGQISVARQESTLDTLGTEILVDAFLNGAQMSTFMVAIKGAAGAAPINHPIELQPEAGWDYVDGTSTTPADPVNSIPFPAIDDQIAHELTASDGGTVDVLADGSVTITPTPSTAATFDYYLYDDSAQTWGTRATFTWTLAAEQVNVSNLSHAHRLTEPTVSAATPVAVADVDHVHRLTAIPVIEHIPVNVQNYTHTHRLTPISVSAPDAINVDNLDHGHRLTPISIDVHVPVNLADLEHIHRLTEMVPSVQLQVDNLAHLHQLTEPSVTVQTFVDNMVHAHRLTVAGVTQVFPPVWGTLPNIISQEGQSGSSDLSQFILSGTLPITYDSVGAPLPPGVTLDSNTGVLSADGTTPVGDYTGLVIRATNAAGSADSNAFTFSVVPIGPPPEDSGFQLAQEIGSGQGIPLLTG